MTCDERYGEMRTRGITADKICQVVRGRIGKGSSSEINRLIRLGKDYIGKPGTVTHEAAKVLARKLHKRFEEVWSE